MKSALPVTFIFCALLVCAPAVDAEFCIVPAVEEGIQRATFVFSGKIVDISRNSDNVHTSNSEFVVKLEVEAWWKGAGNREIQVLWRTDVGCSYFPAGETGERYLVYADPSKRIVAGKEGLLEVTILNRTSKIPVKSQAVIQFDGEMQKRRRVLFEMPELNRFDAAADIQVLRWLKECACFTSDFRPCSGSFGTLSSERSKVRSESKNDSSCCACFRQRLRSF